METPRHHSHVSNTTSDLSWGRHNVHTQKDSVTLDETLQESQHRWQVLVIVIVLCLLSFISAVDATIVTTSLPTITEDIGGGKQYVWVVNSFLFASTVPQPLIGQIANIFGRRNPILVAIALFALGSGVAGGSTSPAILIGGRTMQGLGT